MKYGYIGKINSAKEFQKHVELFKQRGVLLNNIIINFKLDDFLASLADGDTVIVVSYIELFVSLSAYLTTATNLMERGILLESLQESDVVINHLNSEFARGLNALNRRFRSTSWLKGMNKSKTEGKKIGRPCGSSSDLQKKIAQVEKLREQSDISVVNACKLAGCNLKTYYRVKSKST